MWGFDTGFLGTDCSWEVFLPQLSNPAYSLIPYTHFSVYHNLNRKLALYSACNINEKFPGIPRRSFRKDLIHLGAEDQLGDGFYKSKTLDHPTKKNANVFDRGHIISRQYPQWGETKDIAKRGADDTFYYSNAAPQVPEVNQFDWKDLELFIIDELSLKKISVLSGLILSQNDPIASYINSYSKDEEQIQIPLKFWKIVYYIYENQLKRIAFVFKQDQIVYNLPFITKVEQLKESIDPFDFLPESLKTYIVNPLLIEEATNLKFTTAKNYFDSQEFKWRADKKDFSKHLVQFDKKTLTNYL